VPCPPDIGVKCPPTQGSLAAIPEQEIQKPTPMLSAPTAPFNGNYPYNPRRNRIYDEI
jgi:hypothetical protein